VLIWHVIYSHVLADFLEDRFICRAISLQNQRAPNQRGLNQRTPQLA
jgi:hypothetical protein